MRIVHQFAPPMSAMLAGLPGVTSAEHVPLESRWKLPVDADVLFVIHGEGDTRAIADAPRPPGWPGTTKLVQIASAGLDDYPDWLFEAPVVASASGTNSIPIAEYVLAAMLADVAGAGACQMRVDGSPGPVEIIGMNLRGQRAEVNRQIGPGKAHHFLPAL